MTKKFINDVSKYIAFFIFACLASFCFSDSVEDCEAQKIAIYNDLQNINWQVVYSYSEANSIYRTANTAQNNLGNLSSNISGSDSQTILAVQGNLESIKSVASVTSNRLESVIADLLVVSNRVSSIDCTSCTPENGGFGCCDVISNIWLSVSNIHYNTDISLFMLHSISNDLKSIVSILRANTNLLTRILDEFYYQGGYVEYGYYHGMYWDFSSLYPSDLVSVIPDYPYSIAGNLSTISFNLADSLPSINNYLYYYIYDVFFPFAEHMTNNLITLTESSTNFFSFFISSTTARPVLADYNGLDFPSYHAYLTNFYLDVAEGNTAHFTAIQKANTNWFGRIETLIASLVFASAETNPVDDKSSVYEDMAQQFSDKSTQYKDDLTGLVDSPVGVTRSAVSSLRSLSQAFTDASMPEEVNLVSIPFPDGTQSIKFNASGSGSSSFRCVTTIVWVFTALFLVVQFVWYAFRVISHIVIFIWDVLSMIFGGSK